MSRGPPVAVLVRKLRLREPDDSACQWSGPIPHAPTPAHLRLPVARGGGLDRVPAGSPRSLDHQSDRAVRTSLGCVRPGGCRSGPCALGGNSVAVSVAGPARPVAKVAVSCYRAVGRRHTQVAKGTVCKTVIPGFDSRCRLHHQHREAGPPLPGTTTDSDPFPPAVTPASSPRRFLPGVFS